MAQNTRQNRLFAAEDYTVVYESYINANFQAYDYDTIRSAMVDYVRNNYPENYNDWIESSEFVALLDVVAQFGHNLAYRVDLNTRNNFLSTSTRQDSVFKLAEFLGYSPRRNVPAFGEMKVVSVKTNEAVIGSEGTSLGGQELRFENNTNVNNIDDFITIMNAVFQASNNFGSPKKQVVVDGITTEFYDLNNTANQIKFDVSGYADGSQVNYNLISVDYNTTTNLVEEKNPDPNSAFGLYYKNDGRGLTSDNTGFFVGVKQGTIQFDDFTIENSIDNLTLDINTENVNHTDVWVQTIDTTGSVVKNWNKVLDTNSENVIYNSFASGVRDVFSVKTRTNNQISIKFPDRLFGNIPSGNIRVWYRVSENNTYTVRPDDLNNKKLNINYLGVDGNVYTAVLTVQLKQSISTASSSETLDSVRENAPKSYASQDRLITSQDYNSMLQAQVGGVKKIKSVNRTFSGHSRYIDFNDPTGTYSSLDVFGKDGSLSTSPQTVETSSTYGESANALYQKYIKPMLSNDNLVNLYYNDFKTKFEEYKVNQYGYAPNLTATDNTFGDQGYTWNTTSTTSSTATSGYILLKGATEVTRVGSTQTNYMKLFTVGSLIKFKHAPQNGTTGSETWAKVVSILADGLGVDNPGQPGTSSGLDVNGKGAIVLDKVVPNGSVVDIIYPSLSRTFTERESDVITTFLNGKASFGLVYEPKTTSWELKDDISFNSAEWLIYAKYNTEAQSYDFSLKTLRFFFESTKVNFSNISNEKELDTYTNKPYRDSITITGIKDGFISELGKFYIYGYESDKDGITINPKKVQVSLIDSDNDSRPENPNAFLDITNTVGFNNLRFEWNHIAASNEVVDPSLTNIVDVFVLNSSYDTEYRNWLTTDVGDEPKTPTSYNLSKQFNSINGKKSMSDTVVYKPVKYKPLFGPKSSDSLRAKFRVIKLPGSSVTNNDIQTKCVKAINEYFSVNNWDFGETFYFTELAAHVHKSLSGLISSFVIVPQGTGSVFGDLFQITPASDEMFIPDVSLTDIEIIENITDENLRVGS